jgi:hypothetical protein
MAPTPDGDAPRKRERGDERLSWTQAMEEILINSLVSSVDMGHRAENGFKKAAWTAAHKVLRKEYPGIEFKMRSIKSKTDDLKKKNRIFQKLCDNSGFGWDAVRKVPTARTKSGLNIFL